MTMEFPNDSICGLMNHFLRNQDRKTLRPFLKYLKLLIECPLQASSSEGQSVQRSESRHCFRNGIQKEDSDNLEWLVLHSMKRHSRTWETLEREHCSSLSAKLEGTYQLSLQSRVKKGYYSFHALHLELSLW
jgi:hypothetical protein